MFPADLVTFTGEMLNEKLRFLCSDSRRFNREVSFNWHSNINWHLVLSSCKTHNYLDYPFSGLLKKTSQIMSEWSMPTEGYFQVP